MFDCPIISDRLLMSHPPQSISRGGKPIAAVVSIGELKRMEQTEEEARKEYFAWVKEMQNKFKGLKRKEADKLVKDAVAWARKQPH